MHPDDSVTRLSGVGPKRAAALGELGIATIRDLMMYIPSGYEDRRRITPAAQISLIAPAERVVCIGAIDRAAVRATSRRGLYTAVLDVSDDTGTFRAVFFGSKFSFGEMVPGRGIAIRGVPTAKPSRGGHILEFVSPDHVTYDLDAGIPEEWARIAPIYPACASVPRKWLASLIFRVLPEASASFAEELPHDLISSRGLMRIADALTAVHAPKTPEEALAGRRTLAYRELFDAQMRTQRAKASISRMPAPIVRAEGAIERFAASLPFELTPGQREAIRDCEADMARPRPMMRLLQGDVGSGKTAVALASAFLAASAGLQTAVMLPTTVLSAQFIAACVRWLAPLGISCGELRGSMPKRERESVLARAASGELDVLVGTHAVLEEDVRLARPGLIVIDEQHRFGVRQRERLLSGCGELSPHLLMMSATPIPRTLCMALCGDLDISVIRDRPAFRQPIATKALDIRHADDLARKIAPRAARGERAYWVCPLVEEGGERTSVMERADAIRRAAPSLRVGTLYGAMSSDDKRAAIEAFATGGVDVLVSTTVVEVGVDIPDATIMAIEDAASFGLSALHQLRGRVGRGERQGICILLDRPEVLRASSKIKVMLRTDDGFEIAEEDLRERGAGDVAGVAQHGYIDLRAADLSKDADLLEMAAEDARRYADRV